MAVYKKTLNSIEVKIHNVDHPPPHCHAYYERKDLKINLMTLEILNPPPNEIPSKLNKAIKDELDEMRKSWDKVKVIPSGGNPGDW
ncbi:MAG: DUF4160 domain-containing protein [Candidatus Paceibacterota bacterium]